MFVNASGFFNNWKWPRGVPGRESFHGRLLHSAAWPTDADKDIDGRTVSIIGNGSSGIQILPAILDRVEKVYVHIRSPTWITSRIGEKFAGPKGVNIVFGEDQKDIWAKYPEEYLQFRKDMEADVNQRFKMFMDHTPQQKAARDACLENLKEKLSAKPELMALLKPEFAVGYVTEYILSSSFADNSPAAAVPPRGLDISKPSFLLNAKSSGATSQPLQNVESATSTASKQKQAPSSAPQASSSPTPPGSP